MLTTRSYSESKDKSFTKGGYMKNIFLWISLVMLWWSIALVSALSAETNTKFNQESSIAVDSLMGDKNEQ